MDAAAVTELVGALVTGVVVGWHRATASSETRVQRLGENLGPRVEELAKDVAYIKGKLGIAPSSGTIEGAPDARTGR